MYASCFKDYFLFAGAPVHIFSFGFFVKDQKLHPIEQGKCPAVKFFSSLIPMPAKEPLQASNNISRRNRNCGFKLDTLLTAIQAALDKQIVAAKWPRGMVCLLSSPLLVVAYISSSSPHLDGKNTLGMWISMNIR